MQPDVVKFLWKNLFVFGKFNLFSALFIKILIYFHQHNYLFFFI